MVAYLSAGIGSFTLGKFIWPINHFSPRMDIIDSAKISAWSFSAGPVIKDSQKGLKKKSINPDLENKTIFWIE